MTLTNKEVAKENYKTTKANYLSNPTNDNWKKFCDAKRTCMLLGIRI